MTQLLKLKPEQFPVLKGVYDGFIPPEKGSIAVIAVDDNDIIGRAFLLAPCHLEGPWVREDKRGTTLGYRLVSRMEEEAKGCGISRMFAYAVSEEIEDYLKRMGYEKSPMTVWTKDI